MPRGTSNVPDSLPCRSAPQPEPTGNDRHEPKEPLASPMSPIAVVVEGRRQLATRSGADVAMRLPVASCTLYNSSPQNVHRECAARLGHGYRRWN